MEKICLVTSEESFLNNYGAALQGYALYITLVNFGYDVRILRYKGGMIDTSQIKEVLKSHIKNAHETIKHYTISEIVTKINFRTYHLIYKNELSHQRNLFQDFQTNMSFYDGHQLNWHQLKKSYPEADIYVCGSDQIWNPAHKNGRNDRGYFLDFVPNGRRKIAYAPSFGISDLPESAKKDIKELTKSFSAISVREKTGSEILRKYADQDVPVVLDPTLLLEAERWKNVMNIPRDLPEKYILCYRFCDSEQISSKIKGIQKKTRLPVLTLPLSGASYKDKEFKKFFRAGPNEFIGLIKNAEFVCTDSFHATVFSVLMETPFITFLRGTKELRGTNMDSRVHNFLGLAHLENRICSETTDLMNFDLFNIDFRVASENLSHFRKESLQWLENALKENTNEISD